MTLAMFMSIPLGFLMVLASGQAPSATGDATKATAVKAVSDASFRTVIRTATSSDGLAFTDTGRVAIPHAAAADIVRLSDGTLLAVFDSHGPADRPGGPELAVSRSQDDGRTWSAARPIRLRGLPSRDFHGSHGDLAIMPSGLVRVYFQMQENRGRPGNRRNPSWIGSAVTRNGLDYEVDRQVRIAIEGETDLRPSSLWIGAQLDLLVAAAAPAGKPRHGIGFQRYRSGDGRRFEPQGRGRHAGLIGSILANDRGEFRMYLTDSDGIVSMTSRDGQRWVAEPGVRLQGGSDPAVVRFGDDSFLMLYTAAWDERKDRPEGVFTAESESGVAGPEPVNGGQRGNANWPDFTSSGLEAELGAEHAPFLTGLEGLHLAPRPDFVEPIDYEGWFRGHFVLAPQANAYSAYEGLFTESQDGPEWALNDRLNGGGNYGPPAPWVPAEHPDWETSYQASQELMSRFREATSDLRLYQSPLLFRPDQFTEAPDAGRPLFTGMLTGLAVTRGLCKATLAQAWRAENGAASPENMREALQAVLRNANHIEQGATLVESLVSMALRNLAEDEARCALRRNVFTSADEIERALQTLRDNDTLNTDPAQWLQAEHCMIMDHLQYMFAPAEPGGEPGINMARARFLAQLMSPPPFTDEQLARLTPEDAQATADRVESFFSEVREYWLIGYPSVRQVDLDNLLDKHGVLNDPLAGAAMWNPGRVYHVQNRVEASRRATQLAYQVELYGAQNGRYPASLEELPDDGGYDIKVDPFSGDYFRYRLSDEGPVIYTASENGIDDGGVHSPHWADEGVGSDDYVFYPPQH